MTRITAHIIANDPGVYASSYGPVDGKYGIYIGTLEETPSGHKRPRLLLTSKAIYESHETAQQAAEETLREAKLEVFK